MKKLSDYKDAEALDLLANIIEPISEIIADKEISDQLHAGGKLAKAVSIAIKNHREAVFELLAALEGVPVEEYHCTVLTLPAKLIEIFSDEDMASFFGLQ